MLPVCRKYHTFRTPTQAHCSSAHTAPRTAYPVCCASVVLIRTRRSAGSPSGGGLHPYCSVHTGLPASPCSSIASHRRSTRPKLGKKGDSEASGAYPRPKPFANITLRQARAHAWSVWFRRVGSLWSPSTVTSSTSVATGVLRATTSESASFARCCQPYWTCRPSHLEAGVPVRRCWRQTTGSQGRRSMRRPWALEAGSSKIPRQAGLRARHPPQVSERLPTL